MVINGYHKAVLYSLEYKRNPFWGNEIELYVNKMMPIRLFRLNMFDMHHWYLYMSVLKNCAFWSGRWSVILTVQWHQNNSSSEHYFRSFKSVIIKISWSKLGRLCRVVPLFLFMVKLMSILGLDLYPGRVTFMFLTSV